MHIREAAPADEGKALGELLFRFPGKCHDHIGGNCAAREKGTQQLQTLQIPGGVILPLHPPQHAVTPGLHTQMELGAQVFAACQGAAEILRDNPGLQASQPDSQLRHLRAQRPDQLRHRRLARQIHTPAGDLNAGDHDLPVAPVPQLPGLLQRQLQRRGANRPSGIGNDAVGAEVHAAVLHLQHGPGALLQPPGGEHLKLPAAQSLIQRLPVASAGGGLQQIQDKLLPVAAAPQHIHSQLPHRLGRVLGIAAADAKHRVRVLPAAPADHGPVLLIRNGRYRAGVDDISVAAFLKAPDLMARLNQKPLHGLCLILICLTAKRIKCKFHMVKIAKKIGSPL